MQPAQLPPLRWSCPRAAATVAAPPLCLLCFRRLLHVFLVALHTLHSRLALGFGVGFANQGQLNVRNDIGVKSTRMQGGSGTVPQRPEWKLLPLAHSSTHLPPALLPAVVPLYLSEVSWPL